MFVRLPPFVPHGRRTAVVRGTVEKVTAGEAPRYFWGLLIKEGQSAIVTVTIDEVPYQRLFELLVRSDAGLPARTFRIGWHMPEEPLPEEGDRVWVTFAYSNGVERFLEGALPISFTSLEVIKDESQTREHEIVDPQIQLTLVTA